MKQSGGNMNNKLVCVTNRNICYERHFMKDFGETEYNYILGSFPTLRNISAANRGSCVVLTNQLLKLMQDNIPAIILREKDLTSEDYRILAQVAIYISALSDTKLILHSFIDVAMELNYKHLHMPLTKLQELKDSDVLNHFETLGASCHSIEDALLAKKYGATYITAGHIFETDCKKGLPPRGLSFLENVCNSVDIPVYAIGGIDSTNIEYVLSAGATAGCIMSGLM